MVTGLQSGDFVQCVITTSQCTPGEWNPVFPRITWQNLFSRTENIEEDAKYYKEISGLKVNTGKKNIEHGNSNVRRCKFLIFFICFKYQNLCQLIENILYLIILVTSKQFWDQVDEENISGLGEDFAYKHDFEMFSYSMENYLLKIGRRLKSWDEILIVL